MGKRGPAPQPPAILRLKGTYREKRHGKRAKQSTRALTRVPPAPSHLGTVARQVWRETARRLVALKVLTVLDLPTLEGYAIATERARDAEATVAREGRTIESSQGVKRHPELITCEKARAEMRVYEAKLYLTPADRARAWLPDADEDDDPTARALFGKYFGEAS